MSFRRIAETREGRLALKVLKRRHSGELLLAVDKVRMGRDVFGVLLSWTEVRSLITFVRDFDVAPDRPVPDFPGHEGQLSLGVFQQALARAEIDMAIRGVARNQTRQDTGVITILPSLPKFRYVYTCPKCGCHVPSDFRVPSDDGVKLRLCSNCQHVYQVERSR